MSDPQPLTKKPVTVEGARWDGTLTDALTIVAWVKAQGGTARYTPDPPDPHPKTCLCEGLGFARRGDMPVPCPTQRSARGDGGRILVDTLEGIMAAKPTDTVIRGVAGEFYPIDAQILEQTYEAGS